VNAVPRNLLNRLIALWATYDRIHAGRLSRLRAVSKASCHRLAKVLRLSESGQRMVEWVPYVVGRYPCIDPGAPPELAQRLIKKRIRFGFRLVVDLTQAWIRKYTPASGGSIIPPTDEVLIRSGPTKVVSFVVTKMVGALNQLNPVRSASKARESGLSELHADAGGI
jgi:hypothetical protein